MKWREHQELSMEERNRLQEHLQTQEEELKSAGTELATIISNVQFSKEEISMAREQTQAQDEKTTWLELWNEVLRGILCRILDVESNSGATTASWELAQCTRARYNLLLT